MKTLTAVLLLIGFIIWILPLGIFVKPSQEKLFCNGQRGMCMCHVSFGIKSAEKPLVQGSIYQTNFPSNSTNSSMGNYFITLKSNKILKLPLLTGFENPFLCYKNPLLDSLDAVPKF